MNAKKPLDFYQMVFTFICNPYLFNCDYSHIYNLAFFHLESISLFWFCLYLHHVNNIPYLNKNALYLRSGYWLVRLCSFYNLNNIQPYLHILLSIQINLESYCCYHNNYCCRYYIQAYRVMSVHII